MGTDERESEVTKLLAVGVDEPLLLFVSSSKLGDLCVGVLKGE
jgi:hypothetical protein